MQEQLWANWVVNEGISDNLGEFDVRIKELTEETRTWWIDWNTWEENLIIEWTVES